MSSGYPDGSGSGSGSGSGQGTSYYQHQPSSYHHQSHSSHHHHHQQQPKQAGKPHSSASSSMSGAEVFTEDMRDRQARGKDPYREGDGSDDDEDEEEEEEDDDYDDNQEGEEESEHDEQEGEEEQDQDDHDVGSQEGWHGSEGEDDEVSNMGLGTRLRRGNGRLEEEDFATAQRRQKAVAFLDSPELLTVYALKTGQTMAAARLHFMRMLCGFEEDSSSTPWRDPGNKRRGTAGGKTRGSRF